MKNRKYIYILLIIIFISMGFAFLSSNLSIIGVGKFKPNKWDVHFENIVDDNYGADLKVPAEISEDKLQVDFQVNLNNVGDTYYFYVDIVNNGTIDAMINKWQIDGLPENIDKFIKAEVTYADGIQLSQYDLLKKNSTEKLKVFVQYTDDIIDSIEDLPTDGGSIDLTLDATYTQADENAKERAHNEDTESPVVRVNKSNTSTIGNNRWYKNLLLTTKLIDYSGIKSAKYCVTTEESCTPNTPAELENNTFEVQLENSEKPWTVCVESTDNADNTKEYCDKNKYYVDGEVPTISSINVTTADLSLSIEVNADDAHSGVYKYYYSKDGGETYVSSTNSNYTFTGLEEKNYILSVYVEDQAGNESTTTPGTATVREYSWCEKNNISDLGDCIIASEANNSNIEEAKTKIKAKTKPDFTQISPVITYKENMNATSQTLTNTYYSNIGTGYTFDKETGRYTVTGYKYVDPTTIDYTEGDHYTCLSTSVSCATMYKVSKVTSSTASTTGIVTYTMKVNAYTAAVEKYDDTSIGMYEIADDDGESYYYRGAVSGNYVKFSNKFWRIIRVNGDGTVRIIYDGTKAYDNGTASTARQIGTQAFNTYWNDNSYVGYMHGDSSKFQESNSGTQTFAYTGLSPTAHYYYGTDYTFDKASRSFSLAGDITSGTTTEGDIVGLYTCFSTSQKSKCQRMNKITKVNSNTSVQVQGIEYNSTSKELAHQNIENSTMKTNLENWYKNNLLEVDTKINKDTTFCNDRNISGYKNTTYTNDGFGIHPTFYNYPRFFVWGGSKIGNPRLTCENNNDKFSVTNTKGNGELTNPIGLITADEVNLAGGRTGYTNTLYYLYTGTAYWTMSPSYFHNWFDATEMWVTSAGALSSDGVSTGYGSRPVINLNSDLTFTGSGTKDDPYVIE